MARFVRTEQPEITVDYVNLSDASAGSIAPKSCSGKNGGLTAAVPGRKLHILVAVSFGLLCILQAALNISLRLYSSNSKTPDTEVSCTNLTQETAKPKEELINFDHYFQQGWVYFHSLYYISSVKKTWQESRDDCLQRGADLVIINSKEEQDLTNKFRSLTWIGLTDREGKGTWKWVDGTPLNESYWKPGEPNGSEDRIEDCVEITFHDTENSWNDLSCGDKKFWICEKMIAL